MYNYEIDSCILKRMGAKIHDMVTAIHVKDQENDCALIFH